MDNGIDGHDPLAWSRKMHIFVTKEAIKNLQSVRNRKVELPIAVLEDLLVRLQSRKEE